MEVKCEAKIFIFAKNQLGNYITQTSSIRLDLTWFYIFNIINIAELWAIMQCHNKTVTSQGYNAFFSTALTLGVLKQIKYRFISTWLVNSYYKQYCYMPVWSWTTIKNKNHEIYDKDCFTKFAIRCFPHSNRDAVIQLVIISAHSTQT